MTANKSFSEPLGDIMWRLLEQLCDLCAPPALPVDVLSADEWNITFRRLGTRLPEELVQLNLRYGAGHFSSLSRPMNGGLGAYTSGINAYAIGRLAELREVKLSKPKAFPCLLYFEPGGLLPVGWISNKIDICLRTTGGNADKWRVSLLKPTVNAVEDLDMTLLEFFVNVMTRPLETRLLDPETYPSKKGYVWHATGDSVKA
jgi:hypothetical protein